MAKLYGEIQASALMTFDKSFARSNGQPLDSTEVFYSKSAAETYAAGDVAYIGQKIVVVETKTVDNKEVTTVTHYGIEPDASLKELGALPVGDNQTIKVVDGKIQLANIGDDQKSGTFQPFLVNGVIEWRTPSAVTVEGLDARLETAEDDIDSLQKDIEDIVDAIGVQPAEGVTGSGLKKDIADEAAARAAADEELAGSIDDIDKKIGTVASGKTVVKMIEDAQAAATYDDTKVKEDIKANADAIAVLNGDGAGSIDKKITDAFNDFSTKVSDDKVVNSYKELIDWAAEHGSDAAEMAEAITTLQNILKGIGGEGEKATVVAYVTDAINALKIGDYAKAEDLTKLAARVLAMENKVEDWDAAEENAKVYAKGLVDDLSERVGDLEEVEAEKNVINSVDSTHFEVGTDRELKLKDLEISKVTGLQDALDDKVDVESGKRLMTDAEGEKLGGIAEGAQVNIIDDISDEFEIGTGKILSVKKIAMAKIDQLAEEFAKKADKADTLAEYGIADAYTKTETDNLLKAITDDLGDVSEVATQAKDKIDTYEEANDGRVEAIEEKLDGIEEGAQVNKLEGVKLNGTLLSIVEKAVNIPLGAGLKAAATNPEVTIASDGTLGIGKINVNKLEQATGEVLILNCGGASAQ